MAEDTAFSNGAVIAVMSFFLLCFLIFVSVVIAVCIKRHRREQRHREMNRRGSRSDRNNRGRSPRGPVEPPSDTDASQARSKSKSGSLESIKISSDKPHGSKAKLVMKTAQMIPISQVYQPPSFMDDITMMAQDLAKFPARIMNRSREATQMNEATQVVSHDVERTVQPSTQVHATRELEDPTSSYLDAPSYAEPTVVISKSKR